MIIGFQAKDGTILEAEEFVNCLHAAMIKMYHAWQSGTIENNQHKNCGG